MLMTRYYRSVPNLTRGAARSSPSTWYGCG